MELIWETVSGEELNARVKQLAKRITSVPRNQLMMQKLILNQAHENMGLEMTQMFATIFHGMSRHMPEGAAFKQRCKEVGGKQAVAERVRG
jgi:enoyl-CoA hydratase